MDASTQFTGKDSFHSRRPAARFEDVCNLPPPGRYFAVIRMNVAIVFIILTAVLLLAGCQTTRAGYASAPYTVVRTADGVELRDYPALSVVETTTAPDANGSDGSFGRLFRFISGNNSAQQKISMTTPVFMSGGESAGTMAFVLPAGLSGTQVPSPADGKVAVRELPPGRFAVLRYSGGRNAKNEVEALARLRSWLLQQGLKSTEATPVYGYFDPPWTPWFLRRNEVMLRLVSTP